ncbi:MAG: hypothetical protein ABI426_09630 [Flavobacterium sp.]
MEAIIKRLKQEIINHDLVKNSSLFSLAEWKSGHYNILSEIISESLSKSEHMQGSKKNDLGVTISGSTLKRIFASEYTDKGSTDLRFLKTLDKLAIFLGYPNLNSYLLHQSQNEKAKFDDEQQKAIQEIKVPDVPISFFTEMIINYCREEFEIMKKLPALDMERFSDYVFKDSPAYKRVSDMLLKFLELNLHMNCENNRSNYENYGFKLRSINEDTAVIGSKEFWNVQWVDNNGKTFHTHNKASSQLYFFRKINGTWKIWDNHNPGYDSLAGVFLKP